MRTVAADYELVVSKGEGERGFGEVGYGGRAYCSQVAGEEEGVSWWWWGWRGRLRGRSVRRSSQVTVRAFSIFFSTLWIACDGC